jgi:hypothetical protein
MRGSPREGLWSLIKRVFRRPAKRGITDFSPQENFSTQDFAPQEDFSPSASDLQASAETETPAAASPPEQTSLPAATSAGLASIRLIFTDGSVVPLPEGSFEGRKAQYLARRVLETGKGS